MEETYALHDLYAENNHEVETSQETPPVETGHDPQTETIHELTSETTCDHTPKPHQEPEPAHEPESHNLVFVQIEEPTPNWEMELAQAYVRDQPLEGIYPPEEGLRMGTAFPNLSQPYVANNKFAKGRQ